jgi:hypothetical protein
VSKAAEINNLDEMRSDLDQGLEQDECTGRCIYSAKLLSIRWQRELGTNQRYLKSAVYSRERLGET